MHTLHLASADVCFPALFMLGFAKKAIHESFLSWIRTVVGDVSRLSPPVADNVGATVTFMPGLLAEPTFGFDRAAVWVQRSWVHTHCSDSAVAVAWVEHILLG